MKLFSSESKLFQLNKRLFFFILSCFKYGLLTFLIMLVINYAALSKEKEVLRAHGLGYDIGLGQKIFMSCKGEGLPTVIMESNVGSNSDIFLALQYKLAQITKVCVYDRAGLGLSDRPLDPVNNKSDVKKPKVNRGVEFTVERMAEDLHHLITSASQPERPIMFISSELGSLISRFYTQIYQDKVSHLVLLNPLAETLLEIDDSVWNTFWYKKFVPQWYSKALGSAIGLNRILLIGGLLKPRINFMDETMFHRQKHLLCNPTHMFSMIEELVKLNETMDQMKLIWSIKQFPQNVSVTIINSERDTMFGVEDLFEKKSSEYRKLKEAWKKGNQFLESKHPNSDVKHLSESLYEMLHSDPDYLFNLIKDLIVKWRKQNSEDKFDGEGISIKSI